MAIHTITMIDKNNHVFILGSDVIFFSMVWKLMRATAHRMIVISIKIQNPIVSLVPILIFFSCIINNLLSDSYLS
jgi:hypothetical protein